jgi:hypothetical protein
MNADEARERLADYALGLLDAKDAEQVAYLTTTSEASRVEAALYVEAAEALVLGAPPIPLPADVLARIQAEVASRVPVAAGGNGHATLVAERPEKPSRRGLFGRGRRRERDGAHAGVLPPAEPTTPGDTADAEGLSEPDSAESGMDETSPAFLEGLLGPVDPALLDAATHEAEAASDAGAGDAAGDGDAQGTADAEPRKPRGPGWKRRRERRRNQAAADSAAESAAPAEASGTDPESAPARPSGPSWNWFLPRRRDPGATEHVPNWVEQWRQESAEDSAPVLPPSWTPFERPEDEGSAATLPPTWLRELLPPEADEAAGAEAPIHFDPSQFARNRAEGDAPGEATVAPGDTDRESPPVHLDLGQFPWARESGQRGGREGTEASEPPVHLDFEQLGLGRAPGEPQDGESGSGFRFDLDQLPLTRPARDHDDGGERSSPPAAHPPRQKRSRFGFLRRRHEDAAGTPETPD